MPFFNHSVPLQSNIDFTNNQPIAVMVNFAKNGKFIPVFIHYVAEDQSEYTQKVDSIKFTREYTDRFLFCCLITNYGRKYEILLTFHINECLWTMNF